MKTEPDRRQLREAKKGKLRLHSLRLNILLARDANDTHGDTEKNVFFKSYNWVQILIDSITLCPPPK